MTAPGPRGELLGFREGRDAAAGMRERRRAAGLSRRQLAALLRQKLSWVEMREHGAVRMSVGEAEQIAMMLGTTRADLTKGRRRDNGREGDGDGA